MQSLHPTLHDQGSAAVLASHGICGPTGKIPCISHVYSADLQRGCAFHKCYSVSVRRSYFFPILKPGHPHWQGASDFAVQPAGAADNTIHVAQGFGEKRSNVSICSWHKKGKKGQYGKVLTISFLTLLVFKETCGTDFQRYRPNTVNVVSQELLPTSLEISNVYWPLSCSSAE